MNVRTEAFVHARSTDDAYALAHLLLGSQHREHTLPSLADLTTAAVALARGSRRKVLLPLGAQPLEFALARHASEVWVSVYRTDAQLDVLVLDRPVDLATLLRLCVKALEQAQPAEMTKGESSLRQLAEQAARTTVHPHGRVDPQPPMRRTGGLLDAPSETTPLAFGYSVAIYPSTDAAQHGGSLQADTHALLFSGSLWAFLRGKRFALCCGPVMPVVQRLLEAVRLIVDAAESGRPCHIKQRVGEFQVSAKLSGAGLRRGRTERRPTPQLRVESAAELDTFSIPESIEAWYIAQPPTLQPDDSSDSTKHAIEARPLASMQPTRGSSLHIELTLGNRQRDALSVRGLDLVSMARPVLRLASDLLRTLVEVDRTQTRNLRLRALRNDVRSLRRRLQSRSQGPGFINRDPERLRLHSPATSASQNELGQPLGSLPPARPPERYLEKWCVAVDALDVEATFLCGDSLVATTPRQAIAISLQSGDPLWCVPGGGSYVLTGEVLLRTTPGCRTELWDVHSGEMVAQAAVRPRADCLANTLAAGGGAIPPVAILQEESHQLVAIDLRNGEPRWRFAISLASCLHFTVVGRVLIVVSDLAVHALDVATGEVAWRYAEGARFVPGLAICGDMVIVATHETVAARSGLCGIDLYSGSLRWQRQLEAVAHSAPWSLAHLALIGLTTRPRSNSVDIAGEGRREMRTLAAFHPADGSLQWMIPDPGHADDGCLLAAGHLIVHRTDGQLLALSLDSGQSLWQLQLSLGQAELPRRLRPLRRDNVLFVPSRRTHCVAADEGLHLGHPTPPERIPDRLFLDHRGWLIVAEESGQISAHAAAPMLTLVQGGKNG